VSRALVIPVNLRQLELWRLEGPQRRRGCDVCGEPAAWAVRTRYDATGDGDDRRTEFLTTLCAEHGGAFLEGITDRTGTQDA
jgi:hypothetical protein